MQKIYIVCHIDCNKKIGQIAVMLDRPSNCRSKPACLLLPAFLHCFNFCHVRPSRTYGLGGYNRAFTVKLLGADLITADITSAEEIRCVFDDI